MPFLLEKTVLNTLNQIGSEHKNLHKQCGFTGVGKIYTPHNTNKAKCNTNDKSDFEGM